MKHGVAFRKFSRTSSHRMLMLRYVYLNFYVVPCLSPNRNLVTSLIQHEQIKTTLPKAKDAARLAEKVCLSCARRLGSYLIVPSSSLLWARRAIYPRSAGRRVSSSTSLLFPNSSPTLRLGTLSAPAGTRAYTNLATVQETTHPMPSSSLSTTLGISASR